MHVDLHVKYLVFFPILIKLAFFSRNFRRVLTFCGHAYRTLQMLRFLVHQQNLGSAVKNVSVRRRSPPLPTTSLNYIKQLNTILIALDYNKLERADPDSRRTVRASIAAHPVATRKGLSNDKRYMSDIGCDNSGQGSTDRTEYGQYY